MKFIPAAAPSELQDGRAIKTQVEGSGRKDQP